MLTLVLHFNSFTGELQGGYLARHPDMARVGKNMTRAEVIAYLTNNPETRCAPLKV